MPGALEGLKVVDLSRVLGGPYCSQMLGDHGAVSLIEGKMLCVVIHQNSQ